METLLCIFIQPPIVVFLCRFVYFTSRFIYFYVYY
uniref:Uncharacterized protein n=1 Tax=Anguilla anguilla TaxID=7936 RepID=A0A0E9PPR6_ANGAN